MRRPILRRILTAKPLIFEGQLSDDDVKLVLDELPANGLSITRRRASY